MAQTRLEKIGTIYTRVTSLLRSGVMKEEEKPIWYVIYQAFPPKEEPVYGRQMPKNEIREILYKEDVIRARFYKDQKNLPAIDLSNPKYASPAQVFLSLYKQMEERGIPEERLYETTRKEYLSQIFSAAERADEAESKPTEESESSTQ